MEITSKNFEDVQGKITATSNLEDVKDVDFVLEAIAENLDAKRKLFAQQTVIPVK